MAVDKRDMVNYLAAWNTLAATGYEYWSTWVAYSAYYHTTLVVR
jgi:hypothetical protein